MQAGNELIRLDVKAVMPTSGGAAVFLGDEAKVMVIYIDHHVGMAIEMAMKREPRERPQTHDLINSILAGLGGRVDRVVIHHFESGVYYARLFVVAENELHERKILEIDARPSDSFALAIAHEAPIYMVKPVWAGAEDVSPLLKSMDPGKGGGARGARGPED
jgi:hypothetical protein